MEDNMKCKWSSNINKRCAWNRWGCGKKQKMLFLKQIQETATNKNKRKKSTSHYRSHTTYIFS